LYNVCTTIATIMGRDNVRIAYFGSPSNAFTPFVWFSKCEEESLVSSSPLFFTGPWKERTLFLFCDIEMKGELIKKQPI
jgi:hypothetical protein